MQIADTVLVIQTSLVFNIFMTHCLKREITQSFIMKSHWINKI